MKLLAQAFPNKKYLGIISIRDLVLEAQLVNNQVRFIEKHSNNPKWVVPLREELVKEMFPFEVPNYDKPFLPEENADFWAVVNRENEIGFSKYYLLKRKKS